MEADEGGAIDGVINGGCVFWLAGTRFGVERIADDAEGGQGGFARTGGVGDRVFR